MADPGILAAAAALLAATSALSAEAWQGPDSPFTLGEAYPETSATCETVKHWIGKAPEIEARVSFMTCSPEMSSLCG